MSESVSRTDFLNDWIDRSAIAMGRASEEAQRLAEETGTEFIAGLADKTIYKAEPMEPLVVCEGPEDGPRSTSWLQIRMFLQCEYLIVIT